jgi:hypothetical protein
MAGIQLQETISDILSKFLPARSIWRSGGLESGGLEARIEFKGRHAKKKGAKKGAVLSLLSRGILGYRYSI